MNKATQEQKKASNKTWYLRMLGPGLITGASDDDPGTIATCSQAGAQLGFSISWMMLFSYPLMAAIQEISGRIGRTTGRGIVGNIRLCSPNWLLQALVIMLFIPNMINIGADLGAMGDAVGLLIGGPRLLYVVLFGALCAALQIFVPYKSYVSVLRWLTLILFAYFGTMMVVKIPWAEFATGLLIPTFSSSGAFWTTVVAILGATISPYLFVWQASQEVEEIHKVAERKPLVKNPKQGKDAIKRIRLDTYVGMGISNLVGLAIIGTTAATLHANGLTDIETSSQAAEALRPVAGPLAFTIFTLGIVGTGLLAIPVLAGSAAYAVAEARMWPEGLWHKPLAAKGFYAAIATATAIGVVMNFSSINPIKALYWSQVINGIVAVPVMVLVMRVAADPKIMEKFAITGWLKFLGWGATGVMAAAVVGMGFASVI